MSNIFVQYNCANVSDSAVKGESEGETFAFTLYLFNINGLYAGVKL